MSASAACSRSSPAHRWPNNGPTSTNAFFAHCFGRSVASTSINAVEGQRRPAECYVSSELVFVSLAMTAWKLATEAELTRAATMDLRFVGALKALALMLLAVIFTFALAERPLWMVAHAAVFALVLA